MTPQLGLNMALLQQSCQWPSALPCCRARLAARPAPRAQHACPGADVHRDCTLRRSAVSRRSCGRSRSNTSKIASYVEGSSSDGAVYQGMFGEWSVEPEDELEVFIYRAGISVAAAGLVLASVSNLLPADLGVAQLLRRGDDLFAAGGALGLGVSLYFIHIYVTPLKRFIQALWATGCVGAVAISLSQHEPVVQHVAAHPVAVWLVGPFFAAVTGVAFKEGLCYGKAEAAGLFFVTPVLLLGHLTGWVPEGGQTALLVAFNALVLVFAARKYTQPVKDDIGDKSVFQFQALPEDEQERRLAALRARSVPEDDML